jgi:hypothetical protein
MKKFKEEELRPFEIQPLNEDVLGNLSIEELEERLEMQILHVSEAQWCLIDICGVNCGTLCGANCGTLCGANCTTDCVGNCGTLCGANCGTDCGTNCTTDGGGGGDLIPM